MRSDGGERGEKLDERAGQRLRVHATGPQTRRLEPTPNNTFDRVTSSHFPMVTTVTTVTTEPGIHGFITAREAHA